MAIMAMVTVRKINNFRLTNNIFPTGAIVLLSLCAISFSTFAGKWQFTPNLGIEETYTDNVDLTTTEPTSSLVSQAILGLNVNYQSRVASLSFSGTNSNVFFSHDSGINDSYLKLNTSVQYFLWTSGPEFIASAVIDNTSRNAADNSLADLVSGDTIQAETYSTGFRYNINNNTYNVDSSLTYNINKFEDGIGEYNGVTALLNANNGVNARNFFWQLASDFTTKDQDFSGETRTSDQYTIDAQLGLITSLNFNPFIRFYDEDFSGDFGNQNQSTTASWGPGIRWLVSSHLTIDLSYNYVTDDTLSADYIATSVQWEPSARTSLSASYNQRFFGDSYNLDIKHRTRRLTNTVSYNETLEVFDRDNYEQVGIGTFWCPSNSVIESISQCFVQSEQPSSNNFQLLNLFSLEPVESNEFSLNKRFAWASILQLSRTSFAINTSASRREGIESSVVDDTLSASLTIKRKISGKSNLTLLAKYDYLIFDKNNPDDSRQEDHYRTFSATYTKNLASSLSTHFTLQQVSRDSNVEQHTYTEVRAIINITKEF